MAYLNLWTVDCRATARDTQLARVGIQILAGNRTWDSRAESKNATNDAMEIIIYTMFII